MSSNNSNVRTRFAPSPTGMLHIGGLRTALYAWAFAKKTNGTFVVRAEDTDQKRSTPESLQIIVDALKWAGIDWKEGIEAGGDFGPYVQTERLDIYKHYADKLISEGKAYRCYCSEDDLKVAREEWTKNNPKEGFKYPGTCKNKPFDASKPSVVRFAATREGTTEFTDKVFGVIKTPNIENQDWVIMRADGIPLYNWGAVIDDALMKVSTVSRAKDHLANTVPQVLMYQALGFDIPEFVHIGLLRDKDTNEKLSKRNASVSVFEYRDNGFTPSALLNYLARLGWAKGNMEVFSVDEFVDAFDWSGCSKNDAKWDPSKLAAIQFAHLKSETLTPTSEYAKYLMPHLEKLGVKTTQAYVETLIPLVRNRSKNLVEAAADLEPLLRADITIDADAATKFLTEPVKANLKGLTAFLKASDGWSEELLRVNVKSWLDKNGLAMKDVGQPLRISITGKVNSPELFQVMALLGRDITLDRIAKQTR